VYGRLLKVYPASEVDLEATRRMAIAQQHTAETANLK
jgi:hypothetical protein